jgi:hypothetical protein
MKGISTAVGWCAIFLFSASAFAASTETIKDWIEIEIPEATCGDGSPYSVFLRKGRTDKLMIDLMGGGACWDFATCLGPIPKTWIHPIPFPLEPGGVLSRDEKLNPMSDYTQLYFPYCTGDVHLGSHVAHYGKIKVYHTGRLNIERGLDYLKSEQILTLDSFTQAVVVGSSAGALAAMAHLPKIDSWLSQYTRTRVLIADSPGLHFGIRFFDKFSPELRNDFAVALRSLGYEIEPGTGLIARSVASLSKKFSHWNVAVLQSTRDWVMSLMFGDILPKDHEAQVMGPNGIYAITQDPSDSMSAWVTQSRSHALLVTNGRAKEKNSSGKSAMDFVRDEVEGRGGLNSK